MIALYVLLVASATFTVGVVFGAMWASRSPRLTPDEADRIWRRHLEAHRALALGPHDEQMISLGYPPAGPYMMKRRPNGSISNRQLWEYECRRARDAGLPEPEFDPGEGEAERASNPFRGEPSPGGPCIGGEPE